MTVSLTDVLGEKFADHKFTGRLPKLKLEGAIKEQVVAMIKENMKPGNTNLTHFVNGKKYDICLVHSENEFQVTESKYGVMMKGFKWADGYLDSVYTDQATADSFEPDTDYVIIGQYKPNPKQNGDGIWKNFRLDDVLTMDDLKDA